jgi:hypothetical protein
MTVTWSFDHSTIYLSLHLCLAIANDLSLVIGVVRIDRKIVVMQLGINSTPIVLLIATALDWCCLRRLLGSLLLVAYRNYARMRHKHKCNAWDAKSEMLHDYAHLTHTNPYKPFTNLSLAFLVF